MLLITVPSHYPTLLPHASQAIQDGTHPDRINTNLRNTNAFVKYNQQINVINVHRCR